MASPTMHVLFPVLARPAEQQLAAILPFNSFNVDINRLGGPGCVANDQELCLACGRPETAGLLCP